MLLAGYNTGVGQAWLFFLTGHAAYYFSSSQDRRAAMQDPPGQAHRGAVAFPLLGNRFFHNSFSLTVSQNISAVNLTDFNEALFT